VELADITDEGTRVLAIALDDGVPVMRLDRPKLPGMTLERLLDLYMGHPDMLAVYVALPVGPKKEEQVHGADQAV
jgi:hypothetical protein